MYWTRNVAVGLAGCSLLLFTGRPASSQPPHPPLTALQKAQALQLHNAVLARLPAEAAAQQDSFLVYQARFQANQLGKQLIEFEAALRACGGNTGCVQAVESRRRKADSTRKYLLVYHTPIRDPYRPGGEFVTSLVHAPGSGGRTPVASCTAPQITSLSSTQGNPGSPIVINGSGFGQSEGTSSVHLIAGPQVTLTAAAEYWSDTQIVTSVPTTSGIPSYSGNIYVVTCQQSNTLPFQFIPATVVQQLPITVAYQSQQQLNCFGDVCDNGVGLGVHELTAGIYQGGNGNDTYFSGTLLANGWVVSSFSFINDDSVSSGDFCGIMIPPAIGTNNPTAVVHWNVSPVRGQAGYHLSIYISGPQGVAYF